MNLDKTIEHSGKYELKNALEGIVMQELHSIWARHNGCTCEKCFFDVCALALNSLKPIYATTQTGRVFANASILNRENVIEVQVALSNAMNMVSQSPKHDIGS